MLGRPYIRPRMTGPNDGSDISIAVAESHTVPLASGAGVECPGRAARCAVRAGQLCGQSV